MPRDFSIFSSLNFFRIFGIQDKTLHFTNFLLYGKELKGAVFHSNRGSQYTSKAFKKKLNEIGLIQSLNSTGHCFDNARTESFFATLKKEKIYQKFINLGNFSTAHILTIPVCLLRVIFSILHKIHIMFTFCILTKDSFYDIIHRKL